MVQSAYQTQDEYSPEQTFAVSVGQPAWLTLPIKEYLIYTLYILFQAQTSQTGRDLRF
jgi:hypothetical protein